ncbi:DUF2254 domain-containing protein [Roseovarius aestuariivivens]|uniref:DUF2254 domain-containing protein n=1 Tax=Roseovarius aestuariivivens TaxID=1888910 RepID=UPI001081EF3A|nr:DUF2254 domain-containing protein [Roseovarius aestuariivivens]
MTGADAVSGKFMIALRFLKQLWVRVTLMAVLAVLATLGAGLLEPVLPVDLMGWLGPEAVLPVLTILASGMLAVSTFSLNVMVSAHRAAAAQATPRAHRVLLDDGTTQTVLATFIGAFVYALSAIILLKSELQAPGAPVTLMAVTVVVVVLVILAMLRWIDHLSELGSMDATLRATEDKARGPLMRSRSRPCHGARPLTPDTVLPPDAAPLRAGSTGYLQIVDTAGIAACLGDGQGLVWLHVPAGRFVREGDTIGHAAGLSDAQAQGVTEALVIGAHRTFEQDATYGPLVLAEIGVRAMSPGINDPGTAIDVIGRQERLLWDWARAPVSDAPPAQSRVFLPPLDAGTLIENAFGMLARDVAGNIEVVRRLLQALDHLASGPDAELAEASREMAARAEAYAMRALPLAQERETLRDEQDGTGFARRR